MRNERSRLFSGRGCACRDRGGALYRTAMTHCYAALGQGKSSVALTVEDQLNQPVRSRRSIKKPAMIATALHPTRRASSCRVSSCNFATRWFRLSAVPRVAPAAGEKPLPLQPLRQPAGTVSCRRCPCGAGSRSCLSSREPMSSTAGNLSAGIFHLPFRLRSISSVSTGMPRRRSPSAGPASPERPSPAEAT